MPVMEKYQLNYNALLQCISAIEDRVQQSQFSDEQSLRDYYTYTYGIRERMIAKIIFPEATQYSEAIHHIAYSLGLIDNLKNIRARAAKTYVFFTDEEARALSVDKNLVLSMKISEPLKKLFEHHVEKAKQHFQIGADFIRATNRSHLQPLLLRGHLGLQWGDLIKKEQFPLFTHQVELTPLRRWWCCLKYKKSASIGLII
jgi:phytoene synthase